MLKWSEALRRRPQPMFCLGSPARPLRNDVFLHLEAGFGSGRLWRGRRRMQNEECRMQSAEWANGTGQGANFDERPNDIDAHGDRAWAVEYVGGHALP
jgi:hypothetical protein